MPGHIEGVVWRKVLMVFTVRQRLRHIGACQDGSLIRPAAGNIALGVAPPCGAP